MSDEQYINAVGFIFTECNNDYNYALRIYKEFKCKGSLCQEEYDKLVNNYSNFLIKRRTTKGN